MMSFSWLHLTDLHCGMVAQQWRWPGVRQIFFNDLEKVHEKSGPWDLVLFSGDLTQQGSVPEFQQFSEFLEQLWKHFDCLGSNPKLLAVPGNHDLIRPNAKNPAVLLLNEWNQRMPIQQEFWDDENSPYRQVVDEAFKNYLEWWMKQSLRPENINPGMLPGDFSVSIEKDGAKLGIAGLNTAFLQLTDNNYENGLALHARQFHEACNNNGPEWAKQHNACLLLTHHPLMWLNEDSKIHLNGEITDHERFAAHLCGHMHETVYRDIAEGGTDARCVWQSRSLFASEHYEGREGYTAGRIELAEDKGKLVFWPRETRQQGKQMNMAPDHSLELDDEHTCPRTFSLLQSVSGNKHNGPAEPDASRGIVFLAEVTDDLQARRNEIKHYLEQQNFQVVPETLYYFPTDEALCRAIDEDLRKSILFVQLLSLATAHRPAGMSTPQVQYKRVQAIRDEKSLAILQQRDPALELSSITDSSHRALLKLAINMNVEEFKPYIIRELDAAAKRKYSKPEKRKVIKELQLPLTNYTLPAWVFINASLEDKNLAREVGDILIKHAIAYTLPIESSQPAEMRQDTDDNLLYCDAVILLYGKTPMVQVRQQIMYCRRMEGLRETPLKIIAVCKKPSSKDDPLNMYFPNLRILECDTLTAPTCIPYFMQDLS